MPLSQPVDRRDRRRSGVVLFVVLFFALLLGSTVASFAARSLVDAMIARNRESARRADVLARGGVELAQALLLQDRLAEEAGGLPVDTQNDGWSLEQFIEVEEDATLSVRIEDTGARFNLNTLFERDEEGGFVPVEETEPFLLAFMEVMVDELPLPPGEKALYDARELTYNLIDWVDADDVRQRGGPEDDYYQRQTPRYRAYNRPLFSVEELRLIEGFDHALVEGLRPYVSVYPFAPGGCGREGVGCGVNLNTAPPWVLKLLFYNDGVRDDLASEDVVRKIVDLRDEGGTLCPEGQSLESCTPISQIVTNPIFPPPTASSEIFVVTSEARVGDVRRRLEAVVDRSEAGDPRLLSWQVR